jgi:beta-lactam-binding protein with PASTA domain/tRNA A-37 threonylcarbamoyl transferase component Bud32
MTHGTYDTRPPLGGRYALGEVLGYGGMAEVFRGRDVRLGRDVAVKVLRADLARDPMFQARFRREAQAAASLNHPTVVSVYDTGEELQAGLDFRVPYIVMEYVEGRTLRDVLADEGRLQPRRALEITAEIGTALAYAHRAGLVHRDIKPGNVMLLPDGAVKVMDFGIARAVADSSATMTQTAAVMGTAQYLSPEQARGETVDARSDIYSAGCLLYELLTGEPPFRGDSPVAVAYQHVREDPVVPSRVQPELTPAIDAVVLKAMAKNPNNRYQSAEEFREDCLAAADGRPVRATPVLLDQPTTVVPGFAAAPSAEYAEDQPGRRRALWILLSLAVILAIALGFLGVRALVGSSTHGLVKTPNLVGETTQEASQTLKNVGLKLGKTTTRPLNRGEQGPPGTILSQNPAYPFLYGRGKSVDVVVSAGVPKVVIPGDLVGQTQSAVTKELSSLGLDIGNVAQRDNVNADAGTVLQVTPGSGTQVDAYTTVDLAVASGVIDVPGVIGKDQVAAGQILQQAGFNVKVQGVVDPAHTPGTVVNEDPSSGKLQRGSTITLTVAQAPAPEPTVTPTPSGPPTPTATPSSAASKTPTPTPTPTGLLFGR